MVQLMLAIYKRASLELLFPVAYVENRDEAVRGGPPQPLTQVYFFSEPLFFFNILIRRPFFFCYI